MTAAAGLSAATGPLTTEGKAKASKNATKHGLTSKSLLVPGETLQDFDGFALEMTAALVPVGQLEVELVNRAIVSAWRLRRVARLEASHAHMKNESSLWDDDGMSAQALEGTKVSDRANVLVTLTRYEAAIERSMYRALHELQRAQAMRAGQVVSVPAVLDVDIQASEGP